jgi:hypothetical protein
VKNLARLALFFSVCFAAILLFGGGIRFLALRVEWARILPHRNEAPLAELLAAVRWALSLGLYGGLLLGLSYAARGNMSAPPSILCLVTLSMVFCFGVSLALDHWGNVPPANSSVMPLGEAGLILTNDIGSTETAIVLLAGPEQARGPRVVAIPGRPLAYQAQAAGPDGAALNLPPVPFRNETPWFLKSLAIDIRLSAEQFQRLFAQGQFSFLVYAGALIFFLGSLGFILKLSAWPLANFFLGCLAFRGILALETFFDTPEMRELFDTFAGNWMPGSLAVPLIFCAVGVLTHLYSFLVYLVKKRSGYEL